MLRLETIKCKLSLLSLSNIGVEALYKQCVDYVFRHSFFVSCPSCSIRNGRWIRYGTYRRWVVTYDKNKGISLCRLRVQRLLCRHCRNRGELRTHAILADFIVPYRQYSVQCILHFLMLYFTHSKTIDEICSEAGIVPAQLYEWERTLCKNREIWSGILTVDRLNHQKQVLSEFVRYIREEVLYPDFAKSFSRISLKSFLQNHANPPNSHRLRL